MLKKLIAMLLVLLMVVPMLASCGGDKPKETEAQTTKKEPGAILDSEDPDAKVNAEIDAYIEELAATNKFNGKTFTYIGGGSQAPDPDTDGETGDVEKDAFYFRQRAIEENFGITWNNYHPEGIEGQSTHPVVDAVNQDVLAGTKAYDAAYGTPVAVAGPLFRNSALADVSDYTTVDFEREWWPQSLLDTYHINGAVYFLNGPIVSSNYTDTYCVLFNKQVAEDYSITGLYDLVKSGDWTFDKMFEIANAVPSNANGSGSYRFMNPHGMAVLYACGYEITNYDDLGKPSVAETVPVELSNLADKFSVVFSDDTLTVNIKGVRTSGGEDFAEKYDGYEGFGSMFADGRGLFMFESTAGAAYLRKEDVKFGILPMPKKDTAQQDYISYVEPWVAFNVFVPKTTKDHAVTDVILEAMAALGTRYIKPALYDTILKGRSTNDFDSRDMIDIVFKTKKYDIIDFITPDGDTNADSTFVKIHKEAIQETSGNLASSYFLQAKMVNLNITKILKEIEANNK